MFEAMSPWPRQRLIKGRAARSYTEPGRSMGGYLQCVVLGTCAWRPWVWFTWCHAHVPFDATMTCAQLVIFCPGYLIEVVARHLGFMVTTEAHVGNKPIPTSCSTWTASMSVTLHGTSCGFVFQSSGKKLLYHLWAFLHKAWQFTNKQTMLIETPFLQRSVASGFVARGSIWRGTLSWRLRCAATKVHVILKFVFVQSDEPPLSHVHIPCTCRAYMYVLLGRIGLGTDAS